MPVRTLSNATECLHRPQEDVHANPRNACRTFRRPRWEGEGDKVNTKDRQGGSERHGQAVGPVGWRGAVGHACVVALLLSLYSLFACTRSDFFSGFTSVSKMASICVSGTVLDLVPSVGARKMGVNRMTSGLSGVRVLDYRGPSVVTGLGGRATFVDPGGNCRRLVHVGSRNRGAVVCLGQGGGGRGRFMLVDRRGGRFAVVTVAKGLALRRVRNVVGGRWLRASPALEPFLPPTGI